jgi:cobalt-zinc-cadmium efflux system protein
LIAISILVVREAYIRFFDAGGVNGTGVMLVASGGLLVNLLGLWILKTDKESALNVRGAWLHVAADAVGSVGAIAGGFLVSVFGWQRADPVISVLISLLVTYSAWDLLKESVNILMEGVPKGIDAGQVRDAVAAVEGVESVRDLHIWSITSGMVALSMHVGAGAERAHSDLLAELKRVLRDRFQISHSTIQIEVDRDLEDAGTPRRCDLSVRPHADRS